MYHFTADRYTVYHAIRGVDHQGKVYEDAYPKAMGIDHPTGQDIQRRFADGKIPGRLLFILETKPQ